jgi:hypothetical protein
MFESRSCQPKFRIKCDIAHGRSLSPAAHLRMARQVTPFRTIGICATINQNVCQGGEKLDLSFQITPVGDTTSREISAASQELRGVIERIPGVARVEPQRIPAPDHAKGVLVDALGAFALSVAPAVLKAVLQALQTVLSRQPQPTKVLIQTKDGQVSFEFDPKKISLQELVSAAERLRAAAPPG